MSAKDRYHEVVKRALGKSGWKIVREQEMLTLPGRNLYVDLRAAQGDSNLAVLLEIKGFEKMASPVDYLQSVIGQYVMYRVILDVQKANMALYLAVPSAAYKGLLSEALGQLMIEKVGINLMVFDPEKEEVIQWIPIP